MKHIWSITVKELRGYFNSAVALIFLATFLAVVLYAFFFVDRFFARNIADVRPLFEWLPLLLIFLVSALTMRLWSEEQKTGTLEILLTLPVPIHRLVLGKFLAGLILVAIALTLTLGLPLTVSQLGELDWGPVLGGYLAALLLASTYLAVGLCISSTTENQIVALITTMAVCCLLYLPGAPVITSISGIKLAEFLRLLGTGSRFESVGRGVLDIRDLAYYGSLVAVFLTLNTVILMSKRWSLGARTQKLRFNVRLGVGLVVANALLLNVWLAPVTAARVDLTSSGVYSLSRPTKDLLGSLQEPLTIRGFFSNRIHEKLDPLVPQLQDILTEYKIEGGGKVRLAFVDPSEDEELETDLAQTYGIQSLPVRSFSRHESSIINAFFHVLITYGDQQEILSIENFTRVEFNGEGEAIVYLGNIEYEITKAIRKVVQGFQGIETLYAAMPADSAIEAFLSQDQIPAVLKELAVSLEAVAKEFESASGGKLKYRVLKPEDNLDVMARYQLAPLTMLANNQVQAIYFHVVVRMGERFALVPLALNQALTPADLRQAIQGALKRITPGFTRKVAIVVPKAGPPTQTNIHMPPHESPPKQTFEGLKGTLAGTYEIATIDLDISELPDDIDVLLLAGPDELKPRAQRSIDQFLMRGGSVILLAGRYRPLPMFWTNPVLEIVSTGMEKMLAHYGIKVGDRLVADLQAEETYLKLGLRVHQLRYPFYVQVPEASMREGGLLTAGLPSATISVVVPVWYERPTVEGEAPLDVEVRTLMLSSPESWLHMGRDVRPDVARFPGVGFARPDTLTETERGPIPLAVAVSGTLTSAFAGEKQAEFPPGPPDANRGPDALLQRSVADARLVVIGSSAFVSDETLSMANQVGSGAAENNLRLVHNMVDWAVADTDLLSISARRTLSDLNIKNNEHSRWEWMNYAFAFLGLLAVIAISRVAPKPIINLAEAREQARRAGDGDRLRSAARSDGEAAGSAADGAKDKKEDA